MNEREKYPIKYADIFLKMRFGKNYKLLNQNRIKLFCDIPIWMDYIKKNEYNFSFGSRIHGNIISILCNIPALILAEDMRVLEMAQFFEIPYITKLSSKTDLFELYQMLDYEKFNLNFNKKFDNFQNFFDKNNIPCIVGNNLELKENINK